MRTLRLLTIVVLGLAVLTPAAVAGASVPAEVLAAMQRDLGLTAAQAERWLTAQAAATSVEGVLTERLGRDMAGSWFDSETGKLVVNVTSPARVREVREAGASPRVVAHGLGELTAVERELLARKDHSVLAVRIDPRHNAVAVTVHRGSRIDLAEYGDLVRVEESVARPQVAVDRMDAGDLTSTAGGSCSAGFNMRAGATTFLLSAGHCAGGDVFGDGSVFFGRYVAASFPGDDFGLVRNDNPAYWSQQPTIVNYGDATRPILSVWGVRDSPVGGAICKSGITTGVTCGVVDAKNETVNYTTGTVHGLTRHTACVEPGDSGGPNYSSQGNPQLGIQTYAEGITSGTQLRNGRCLQFSGGRNQGWFQPVGEALTVYGAAFGAGIMTVTA